MSACVNCGQRGFKDVDGSECQSCGFKKIATRELAPAQLIFCVDCGNHFLEAACVHPQSSKRAVKK